MLNHIKANSLNKMRKPMETPEKENEVSDDFTDKTYEFLYKKIKENDISIRIHRTAIILLLVTNIISIIQNLFF